MKEKLVVIDGNSILNRAFYGIMGSRMLQTADGTYTNAVYGFLANLFKLIEDLNPEYMAVAFDVKHPTKRHEMYKDYKVRTGVLHLSCACHVQFDVKAILSESAIQRLAFQGSLVGGV